MDKISIDQFKKLLTDFIPEAEIQAKVEGLAEAVDELHAILGSPKITVFTDKINKMFEEKKMVDEDGNPLRVENPQSAFDGFRIDGDLVHFTLTEEQDRWFRSNQLYGDDILGKLGFKYITE
jgi:hypothetical protein